MCHALAKSAKATEAHWGPIMVHRSLVILCLEKVPMSSNDSTGTHSKYRKHAHKPHSWSTCWQLEGMLIHQIQKMTDLMLYNGLSATGNHSSSGFACHGW